MEKWIEKESETPSSMYSGTCARHAEIAPGARLAAGEAGRRAFVVGDRSVDQSRSSMKQMTPARRTAAANAPTSCPDRLDPRSSTTCHPIIVPDRMKRPPNAAAKNGDSVISTRAHATTKAARPPSAAPSITVYPHPPHIRECRDAGPLLSSAPSIAWPQKSFRDSALGEFDTYV